MNIAASESLDFVEELRLRRWARINHVPLDDRDLSWHAVILDEMSKKDLEREDQRQGEPIAGIAPLGDPRPRFHAPHGDSAPRFLASPQRSSELYYT